MFKKVLLMLFVTIIFAQSTHELKPSYKLESNTEVDIGLEILGSDSLKDKSFFAIMLFKDAANNSNRVAQFILGKLNYDGNLIEKNYSDAYYWFNLATS